MSENFEFIENIICPGCKDVLNLIDDKHFDSEFLCKKCDIFINFHDKQFFSFLYSKRITIGHNDIYCNHVSFKDYLKDNFIILNYDEIYDNYSLQEAGQLIVNSCWENLNYFIANYGMFM